ncbi:MAG: RluA family pseudouridine synthase [Treponemataceae bacterium]|nr:RluA family pseudouridine synthase [Treponemataceae bacterium]
MEWKEFTLGENDAGRRLDRLALRLLPHRTHGQIYSAIRKGLVKLEGRKVSPGEITREGETLSVAAFLIQDEREHFDGASSERNGESDTAKKNPSEKIQVIFQNRHLLFVNKPKGIPVHGENSLAQILLESPQCFHHFHSNSDEIASQSLEKNSPEKSISFRPGPLHRLDKGTTGIIAFSKSLAGAQWFSEEIKSHSIKKIYIGIAEGTLAHEEEWLEKIDGKEARTKATPLAYGEIFGRKATLAQYEISTGRKHQIRIHSETHGHPLAGDTAHGGNGGAAEHAEESSQGAKAKSTGNFFLHALEMTFPENNLGIPPKLCASLHEEFRAAIAKGFGNPEKILKKQHLENIIK